MKSQELFALLVRDRAAEKTSTRQQIAYRMQAEGVLGPDENLFKIEHVSVVRIAGAWLMVALRHRWPEHPAAWQRGPDGGRRRDDSREVEAVHRELRAGECGATGVKQALMKDASDGRPPATSRPAVPEPVSKAS
jgi:hypothetical protein